MSGPRIGELFAGYGGLGMGVQAVYGGEVVWVSEFDKGPSKILAHRFPGVPNHGDITKINWADVESVDILTGGSPCQDLSHAGRRAGMTEGTRSNLWVAMREAIAQLRPQMVVWENVGGAFSAAADSEVEPCAGCVGVRPGVHLRALGRVLGDLSSLGYDASWHAVRASDVGAPHGRLRVFVVAEDSAGIGREVGFGSSEAVHARRPIRLERPGRGRVHGTEPDGGLSLLSTPAVNDMGEGKTVGRWDEWTADMQAKHGNGNGHGKSLAIEAQRLLPTPTTAPAEGKERWGDYAATIARWERLLGRPAPEPTMTSSKGNQQLSPAFVEWMMGLPAGWVTDVPGITRNEALKALGNGVVPQQAAEALQVMAAWQVAA